MNTAIAENRTILKDAAGRQVIVPEESTQRITLTLLDETGAAVPLVGMTTVTLTIDLRDADSHALVNSVEDADIKNTGRGTIHPTSGLLTLLLEPNDNQILDDTVDLEWHRLLIEVTYNSTQQLKYEIEYQVRNLVRAS